MSSTTNETYNFPPDFKWAVATAGHQIEGDNIASDWWAWEQIPGKIKKGEKSGKASYHLERMEEDVAIMKEMGVKVYRFSMEWSRIEPKQGEFDPKGIAIYRRLLDLLKAAGIEPMVTIHHFVQPQWFTASGGWRREDSPDLFMNYVRRLEKEFGKDVVYWVTFNEPTVLLIGGYGMGWIPPGEASWNHWKPEVQMMKSHAVAYRYLHEKAKENGREVKVGLAHHLRPVKGGQWFLGGLVKLADWMFNWTIPLALKTGKLKGVATKKILGLNIPYFVTENMPELVGTQDFIGVNYYTRELIKLSFTKPHLVRDPYPECVGATEYLNWGIDPEGFFQVLKETHEHFPDVPFFITENGLCDATDKWRGHYVRTHLKQIYRAMKELPHKIEGYCHWSLMDNFEWQEGYDPRFGLIAVDYANGGARTWRSSAHVVKSIYTSGVLTLGPEDLNLKPQVRA